MTNWQPYKLGELSEWKSGGTPPKNDKKFWNGDIPWISAKNLTSSRISTSDICITQLGLEKGSRLANKDSLLLLVRGSGLFNGLPVGIVEKPVAFNQDVKAIEVNKSLLDPWFLLYWIIGNKALFDSKLEATGIGAGKFDLNILKELEIKLPPIEIQRKVADIARCWDDKIELNRRMNQTLEQMAQTLFRQYFVDSIDSNNLPEGWRVGKLDEIVEITSSKRIFLNEYVSEGIPFYRGKEIGQLNRTGVISTELFITQDKFDTIKSKFGVPVAGDILLTSVGTIGIPYLVNEDDLFYFKDGNLTWFRNYKDYVSPFYVYQWLISEEGQASIDNITIGSTQKAITIQSLKSISFIIPPKDLHDKIVDQIEGLRLKINQNIKELKTLINLRDTLLPKLMSGEIDVMQTQTAGQYEEVLS